MRTSRAGRSCRATWAISLLFAAPAAAAWAQQIDVERPHTFVVGTPGGGSRVDRVDGARTGLARTTLPTSGLRVSWEASVGALTEQAPMVDARGSVYVVGTRGEVVTLGRDGVEIARVAAGGGQPGPAALLSDDTVAFVETAAGAGVAVGVRDGRVRWRTHFGRADPSPPAPLALGDGGVVVATANDLAVLDADGQPRARATLPEAVTAPLISASGRIVLVTATGTVWTWAPGNDPTRTARFGSPIDGSAALADDHTLLAVTNRRTHLTAIDLERGTVTTRAASQGADWSGPPAIAGPVAFLIALAPGGDLAVALDPNGHDVARALIGSHTPAVATDGGAASTPVTGSATPPLVDSAGTFAFATSDGRVGVVPRMTAGGGTVEMVTTPCSAVLGSGGKGPPVVAGLAPLANGVLLATCRSGTVVAVEGAGRGRLPDAG